MERSCISVSFDRDFGFDLQEAVFLGSRGSKRSRKHHGYRRKGFVEHLKIFHQPKSSGRKAPSKSSDANEIAA